MTLAACLLPLLATGLAAAQDLEPAAGVSVAAADQSRPRHVLIVVGLPGDEERLAGFQEIVTSVQEALQSAGAEESHIQTLFGRGDDRYSAATQENIASAVDQLRGQLQPSSSLWVFLLGHGSEDGRTSVIHLPGPDLDARQWADLFAGIECREEVFWLTQSASGGFVKALSRPGRVVITATAASGEVNETEYPRVLAKVLRDNATDTNGDGVITVLELFAAARLGVAAHYELRDLLATEHPQLDDNGDGRGSEDVDPTAEEDIADPLAPKPDGLHAAKFIWRSVPLTPPATEDNDQ